MKSETTGPRVTETAARFQFIECGWENSVLPTIVRDSPTGGDPHILAVLQRIHDPAALHELCRLANAAMVAADGR